MSLTRFNDDDARIKKKLQEMTGVSQYQLNAPGPGIDTPFFEDTHIRLQKWGANLRNNTTNLESDLIGINRKNTKNTVEYTASMPSTSEIGYKRQAAFIDETRASNPAWTLRDLEHTRWTQLGRMPVPAMASGVAGLPTPVDIPFLMNESTRLIQKQR
ncbi:MAG: hypothetical protein ACOVRN_18850 [Flavobacterium sp.]